MKRILNYFNTSIYGISFILLVVSFAISIPLLWREFYYFHIDALNLVKETGYSKIDLIASYNELMDSLIFYRPFGEGVFKYSESGMNHFLDCRILFSLNFIIFIISFLTFFTYLILIKIKKIKILRPKGFSILFYMSFVPIIILGSLGIFALIDVEKAYEFFHAVLFPGKDNWIFNSFDDPIIEALPEQFFLNCGILIFSIILLILLSVIIFNIINKIKQKKLVDIY